MSDNGTIGSNRARAWCFTANVPEWISVSVLAERVEAGQADPGFRYICYQQEIAPSTLQLHYQGYVHFGYRCYFKAVRKFLFDIYGVNCHVEPARGSPSDNKAYCSKEPGTNFTEHGKFPDAPGTRNDLKRVAQSLIAGKHIADIVLDHPSEFIKYHGGIKALHTILNSKPRDIAVDPVVYWWFGPTGVGKSKKAYADWPDAYRKMNNKWWDGYLGQSVVILDDYRPSLCTFQELLRILDRYPMRVEMKGSSIELSASVFVITTTSRPEVIWNGRTEEALDQLLRRITHIAEFSGDGVMEILKSPDVRYHVLPLVERGVVEPNPVTTFFRPS